MSKKHEHPEPKPACQHDHLKYCAKCVVVECEDCGEEFTKKNTYQTRAIGSAEELEKLVRIAQEESSRRDSNYPWREKAWPFPPKANWQFYTVDYMPPQAVAISSTGGRHEHP